MYKDERFELISNLINILEEKNMYGLTEKRINKEISTTLKEWCRLHSFNYISINNSHIINCEDNFYLLLKNGIDITGNEEIIIEECGSSNNYGILKIKKIEKPFITSSKKLYKFIRDIKKKLESTFVERIKLEDFLYCNELDKYCLLCSLKKFSDEYNEKIKEIKISAINLFFGKSPYLFKGNEINTLEELMLLKEKTKWRSF